MQFSSSPALERAKQHVSFHHHQTSGWITIAKREECGNWR